MYIKLALVSAALMAGIQYAAAADIGEYSGLVPSGCTNKMNEAAIDDPLDVQYYMKTCSEGKTTDRCVDCGNRTSKWYWHCGPEEVGFKECEFGCNDQPDGTTITCSADPGLF